MRTVEDFRESWEFVYKRYKEPERTKLNVGYVKEDIIKKLNLNGQQTLLDIGCGNGRLMRLLKPYTLKIKGIDFSSKAIKLIKRTNKEIDVRQAEAIKLPFEDNSFDRVLCYGVFHYFPNLEYAHQAIKEMLRVCKKDGIILIGGIPNKKNKLNFYCPKHKIKLLTPLKIAKMWSSLIKLYIQNFCGKKDKTNFRLDWLWLDIDFLCNFINSLGYKTEILDLPQEIFTHIYRKNILIFK